MSTHKDFNSAFKSMYRKINSVKSTLPNVLANEGTKFFVSNFALSGFTDVGFSAWKPIKVIKNKKVKANRKILVKTGRLRRAVNNSVIEKTFSRIVWSVNKSEVPYAGYNNFGDKHLPKRKFMGKSEFLNKRFKLTIKQAYQKAFN